MCGIFCSLSRRKHHSSSKNLHEALRRRGPDSFHSVSRQICSGSSFLDVSSSDSHKHVHFLDFTSSVLALRGDSLVTQPLEDPQSSSLLCWNGEAWKIGDDVVSGNDAPTIFTLFQNAVTAVPERETLSAEESLQCFIRAVELITGPYAFIFYDALHRRMFYGRDALGRRSLVVEDNLPTSLQVASICDAADLHDWTEVEADGVYMISLPSAGDDSTQANPVVTHIARRPVATVSETSMTMVCDNIVPLLPETLTDTRLLHSQTSILGWTTAAVYR